MKVTNNLVIDSKLQNLEKDFTDIITDNNTLLQNTFSNISFLSSVLAPNLNQMTVLADQVTDALVITGNTKLGTSISDLPVLTSKNIEISKDPSVLKLKKIDEVVYQSNVSKSTLIAESNNYSIYNTATNTLGSLSTIINGEDEALIRSSNRTYKYTFSLAYSSKVLINTVEIQLGIETESYPLVSEIYYIDENNRKINCYIHNNKSNSIDLDLVRVKDNKYEIQLEPVQTNRLNIVLEDSHKSDLVLKTLQVKRTNYEQRGSITFGPLVSSLPILKASISSSVSEGVRYYVSHNNQDFIELVRTGDIDLIGNNTKVARFNTVNENSVVSDADVNKLYFRIDLNSLDLNEEANTLTKIGRSGFTTYYEYISTPNLKNISVYSDTEQLSYGYEKIYRSYPAYRMLNASVVKIKENENVKVKGFIDTDISYAKTSDKDISTCSVYTLPLKKGANIIGCKELEPYSLNLYGFILNKTRKSEFNTEDKNIVLRLKSNYANGVYKIRQSNKEIEIDLSNGFISSCSDVIVVTEKEGDVILLDELGKVIKTLTVHNLDKELYTINLLKEDMFELPKSDTKTLNLDYPFILNTEESFSIEDYSLVNTERLLELDNVYTLTEEKIDTLVTVSKENENTIKPIDFKVLDRYTKTNSYTLEAFSTIKAVKLNDKNLKEGTVKVVKYSDPFLTEVKFNNGIEEFKILAYSTETFPVQTTEKYLREFEIQLTNPLVDIENIQVNIKNRYESVVNAKFISEEEKTKLIVYSDDYFFDGDQIEIVYLHINEQPTNYYSVDHDNGIFYLSNYTNSEVSIEYQYFNTYIKGTKAIQLDTDEYNVEGGNIEIKEKQEIENYTAIYEYTTLLDIPKTTPIIQDTKIHYINTRDEDSLL